jgi:hypothetical protein
MPADTIIKRRRSEMVMRDDLLPCYVIDVAQARSIL